MIKININEKKSNYLLEMLPKVIKPAYGCTEIGIIALVAAEASKILPQKIVSANLYISEFIYRNVSRVGVPKLGKCGEKLIAAAGLVLKNPEKKLASLLDLTNQTIEEAKNLAKSKVISIIVSKNVQPVYARMILRDSDKNIVDVLIEKEHDKIVYSKLNNEYVNDYHLQRSVPKSVELNRYTADDFTLNEIYEICKKFKIEDLQFLKDGLNMNRQIAEYGLENNDPKNFTKLFLNNMYKKNHGWKEKTILYVGSAIDARMSGCPLPVMSSCDSGDHGLTVFIPQYIYAEENKISELTMLRALAFAHCVTWVIKKNIGHLSAYCGSVIAAATATLSGIAFQKNFTCKKINNLINYCICCNGGCLCDGAKNSCTFKVINALLSGFEALEFIDVGVAVDHLDGIISMNCIESIKNIGYISQSNRVDINTSIIEVMQKLIKKWKK